MGLDKIISSISEEAANEEQNILSAAKEKADKITAQAKEDAEKEYENIVKQAKKKCEQNSATAYSTNASLDTKAFLNAKVEAIYGVLAELKNTVINLPEKEYFDFLKRLVKEYAKSEGGVLIFGKADINRLPSDFLNTVNSEIQYPVKLSGETAEFENGFILKFGDIEENCSIDALLAAKQDILKDKIAETLFGE